MSLDERKSEITNNAEDVELTTALRHFRESVHDWSDREFSRMRASQASHAIAQRGWWARMHVPVLGWALGCAVAIGGVSVPVALHQRRAAEAHLRDEQNRLKQIQEEEKLAAANTMSDEDLLSHVDSDIAQATPDAMEPLASLMRDSATK
jgi:hypothetical protein